jgi:hypothetical protein
MITRSRLHVLPTLGFVSLFLIGLLPSFAEGNPRPLPFSYPYETLPRGKFEIEQYVDMVPMRVARENPVGTEEGVFGVRSVLQTELEYGITDRLEFGWYFVVRQGASANTPFLRFQGVKQRLRLRLAEEGEWPVNVGLYLELAEFHNEFELEEKILLSRRFGSLNLVANLWVEQEYYFQTDKPKFIYNPTVGATYELAPNFIVGAEYWARGRCDSRRGPTDINRTNDATTATYHYVGPTFLAQSGEVWMSVGAYVRLDDIASDYVVGEPFGKVWIRTLIGVGL